MFRWSFVVSVFLGGILSVTGFAFNIRDRVQIIPDGEQRWVNGIVEDVRVDPSAVLPRVIVVSYSVASSRVTIQLYENQTDRLRPNPTTSSATSTTGRHTAYFAPPLPQGYSSVDGGGNSLDDEFNFLFVRTTGATGGSFVRTTGATGGSASLAAEVSAQEQEVFQRYSPEIGGDQQQQQQSHLPFVGVVHDEAEGANSLPVGIVVTTSALALPPPDLSRLVAMTADALPHQVFVMVGNENLQLLTYGTGNVFVHNRDTGITREIPASSITQFKCSFCSGQVAVAVAQRVLQRSMSDVYCQYCWENQFRHQ